MCFKTRKLISLLLSLIMLFSLVSLPVYAEEEMIDAEVVETAEQTDVSEEVVVTEETDASDETTALDESDEEETTEVTVDEGVSDNDISDTKDGISLMEEVETVTYPVEKGETWSFENIGITINDVAGLRNVDYVLYYKDGSIKEYYSNSYPGTISVPAGGKLCITAFEYLELALADDYFIVEEQTDPVMNRITMLKGECYTFENIGQISYELRGIDWNFDYILYDTDGNIVEYNVDSYLGNRSIPAGYSIKIVPTSGESTICLLYDKFTAVKNDLPVMRRITMHSGETYTFTNIGDVEYLLKGIGWSFDYILYDTDGNIVEYGIDSHLGDKSIPAGYSIKMVSISGEETICLLYDKFNIEKNDLPVMKRITMHEGEAYTFTNVGDTDYLLKGIGWSFDYILYDTNGNIVEYNIDSHLGDKSIPAGYSIKMVSTSGESTISLLYDKFTFVKNDLPIMKRITMYEGEAYTFTNVGDTDYLLKGIGWSFDYILYDTDGNIVEYGIDSHLGDKIIPAGYSIKMVLTSGEETICLLYDKFTFTKDDTPAFLRIKGYKGETYSFLNTSNVKATIYGDWADYVIYYANGNVKETVDDGYLHGLELAAGNRITVTITQDYMDICVPYELFEVIEGKTVNDYYTFDLGKTYVITNNGSTDKELLLNGGGSWNYTIYDAMDAYSTGAFHSTYGLTIPKGGKAYVEAYAVTNNSIITDEDISVEEYSTGVRKLIFAEPNQVYKITNKANRDLNVCYNGLAVDYIIYNADDSIMSYDNSSTTNSFTVPANGYIQIMSDCSNCMIYFLNECFTYEKCEDALFVKTIIKNNETFKFKNVSDVDRSLLISNGNFDYVIYNADDTIYEVAMCANVNYLNIPSGCTAVITPCLGYVSVSSLNNIFEIYERNYPVFKRISVGILEDAIFSNMSDIDRNIYSMSNNLFNYSTYDSAANVQEAQERGYIQTLSVPANGMAKMKALLNETTFAGLYEYFSDEDMSVKVTGISLSDSALTLLKGKQTVLKANILPEDATNKTVIWTSSDKTVATVAQTGKITAKGLGTATITATTADGGYSATCIVTVVEEISTTVSVTGVTLNKTALSLEKGKTETLTATVVPDNATNKGVTWTSSNTSVASVSNGTVTAKSAGTATITVTTKDGGYKATCTVTVTEKIIEEVNAPKIKISDVKAMPGKEVQVTVELENNTGFANLGIEVGFDADVMTLTKVTANSNVGGTFTPAQNYSVNPFNMSWDSATNITYNGNLVTLTFTVAEDAEDGVYPITVDYYKGVNGNYIDGISVNYDENFNAVGFVYNSGNILVSSYTPGDINDDGFVDSKDATYLLRYLAGWTISNIVEDALDVDGSSVIDSKDATILLRYLAGWDVTLH